MRGGVEGAGEMKTINESTSNITKCHIHRFDTSGYRCVDCGEERERRITQQ